jgi:hypothetical protein
VSFVRCYPRLQTFYDLTENLVLDYVNFLHQAAELVELNPLVASPIRELPALPQLRSRTAQLPAGFGGKMMKGEWSPDSLTLEQPVEQGL